NNNAPGSATGTGIYTDQFTGGGTVQNVLIDANRFEGNADAGLDFSSSDATKPATNIAISNNVFSMNARALVASALTESSIVGNDLLNATSAATADLRFFEGATNLTITGNRMTGGAGRALRVSNIGTGGPNASGIHFNLNSVTSYALAYIEVD